jgi:hypothetical protein
MRGAVKWLVAVILLVLWGGAATAKDLVLVDAKMGYYDRINDAAGVVPGINGGFWSTWTNVRDSSGWLTYDTLWRVILTYRYESNGIIHVHDIDWAEWAYKLRLESDNHRTTETAWISVGPKINQVSGIIGPEEARRWWTADYYDDYWPIVTHLVDLQPNASEFTAYLRPYYTNQGVLWAFGLVPDSNLAIGYNPAHFRYLVVHLSAVPYYHDTLRVATGWNPDCSRIFWTPDDSNDPELPRGPEYEEIDAIPADPLQPGVYHIDGAALGLPAGSYDLQAQAVATIERPAFTVYAEANVNLGGAGESIHDLVLTPEQIGQHPQVLEFWQGDTLRIRTPLGYLEEQWPAAAANIVPIPWRAN